MVKKTKKFSVGDRVVRNPKTWVPNDFDRWGRGEGIGVVVEPPFPVDEFDCVDVRWPNGQCFEKNASLLLASEDAAASE